LPSIGHSYLVVVVIIPYDNNVKTINYLCLAEGTERKHKLKVVQYLLFLCYVNDMRISIDQECKLILYADDSAILFAHKNPSIIFQKLGQTLESCSSWLVDNKLSLHLGKSECLIFGSKRKLKQVKEFKIVWNGHTIESTKSVKYLGLNIYDSLSGESIVKSILTKVNSRLKFLYRQANVLNFRTRKYLCSALIQCHHDYACSSWYPSLNKCFKNKLQILSK
jgi:hypothetical protein